MTTKQATAPSPPIAHDPARVTRRSLAWLRLARPEQWIKNFFVLAPLIFSGRLTDMDAVLAAVGAFLTFCILASGVYAWNDVIDVAGDRVHPTKRLRPIASGEISELAGAIVGTVLVVAGLGLALMLDRSLAIVAGSYLALNILYARWLKHLVIVDVFVVASFFILRLVGGAGGIDVVPSVWLLLCGGLLALYLGFAKRRHELTLLGSVSTSHRSVLSHYSLEFLDQVSVVLLSSTIISYVMYTLTSHTATVVGSEALSYSTIFVLYGVFRYLYLVHRRSGGSPTETLLTDRALLLDVALWLLYCGWVVYRPF